jgi:hypothetical protein
LNKEQTVLINPSLNIANRDNFSNKSNASINKVYERVFDLLLGEQYPTDADNADVWEIFCIAENVMTNMDSIDPENKADFFENLTDAINEENRSSGDSFDETFGDQDDFDDDEEPDDDDDDFPGS